MVHSYQNELSKAIDAINKNIKSREIYLFGSYAEGHPNESSDLDLCILTDDLQERKIEALKRIRQSMSSTVSMPVDLLIYTASEFHERARLSSTLEHKILRDGVLVYGA